MRFNFVFGAVIIIYGIFEISESYKVAETSMHIIQLLVSLVLLVVGFYEIALVLGL